MDQLQDLDGGLNDLIEDAQNRIAIHTDDKFNKVQVNRARMNRLRHVMGLMTQELVDLRYQEVTFAQTLLGVVAPQRLQEEAPAIAEDKQGRFAQLADMLTQRD